MASTTPNADTFAARPASSTPSSAPWTPSSWRTRPIKQAPDYPDRAEVDSTLAELSKLPPLVQPNEILKLKSLLRSVAQGKAFLLQGGDCAELFSYCRQDAIESKIKLLLQLSLVLILGADKPVVRVARMAGQYAKPRSSPMEMVDGKQIPSFRGDILNGFHPDERELDPRRLLGAYNHSAATLNCIRGSLASGLADLHSPLDWELGHVRDPELKAKYTALVDSITKALRFMRTIQAESTELESVDLFTSHEGLLLDYEEALTRRLAVPSRAATKRQSEPAAAMKYYDTSAHFLWIGDRTRQIDHAHLEFFRGIENPVGVKIGPTTSVSDLTAMLDILNPSCEIGKITLITRYGVDKVRALLPSHIRAVESSRHAGSVVWQCDPMHGNTRSTSTGIKTRKFADILAELREALAVHAEEGSYLGGVHLEITPDAVTECVGGSEGLDEDDLSLNYTSFCDPRLNEKQALELAFLVAGHFQEEGAVKT